MVIATENDGIVDVSDDLVNGNVELRENSQHTFSVTMNNAYRKYDGMFTPNDRVTIQMKRLSWLQIFSGYLNSVPYYSAYPRPVTISGECTMKIMRNWPWDAHSSQAISLIHGDRDRDTQDGGIASLVPKIMSTVVNWPLEKIHIGRVPSEWADKFQAVYKRISDDQTEALSILGVNPILSGQTISVANGITNTTGMAGSPVAGSVANGIVYTDGDDKVLVGAGDIDVVLATIKHMESGASYTAINHGNGLSDIASGAYQYVTTTWHDYGGVHDAYLASAAVQDARATSDVQQILAKYGNLVVNIPYYWYYPIVFRDPTWLDKVPAAEQHNTLTIRQYGHKWLTSYVSIYKSLRNGADPPGAVLTTPSTVVVQTSPKASVLSTTDVVPSGGLPASATGNDALYPIPTGINQTTVSGGAWGGYSNGKIPLTSMVRHPRVGYGHPAAIAAYTMLVQAGDAAGFDFSGACYRTYEAQLAGAAASSLFAAAGQSIHGWGLAIDLLVLTGGSKKYHFATRAEWYATSEYQWLRANAHRWGWDHPVWAQQGGSKPEPWHWEFLAFPNFRDTTAPNPGAGATSFNAASVGSKTSPSSATSSSSTNPISIANGFGSGSTPFTTGIDNKQLFAGIAYWEGDFNNEVDPDSINYVGLKAPMNDTPFITTITDLISVSGRNYCAAPNGDFIAWFPDYWGEFGISGRVNVEMIELENFNVEWNDNTLITHQYVEGSMVQTANFGPLPGSSAASLSGYMTYGVATVEIPKFLESLVKMNSAKYPWLSNSESLLAKFGARISRKSVPTIQGQAQEFWYAVQLFAKAWASQFTAEVPMTFMPELFPGMLLCIPDLGVQFYVTDVHHEFDMTNNQGFKTSASVMAPSAVDGSGFYLFAKGGVPVRSTTTFRQGGRIVS